MGLLDQVIGGVVGQVLGGGRGGALASPVVKALLMLLLAKGASGGLGDILGRGSPGSGGRPLPGPGADDGDLGGFNQGRRSGPPGQAGDPGGDFSDLAGMLDGPGDGPSGHRSPGEGPYAGLDREPQDESGAVAGGLDGLIQSFERSGLGDVIGSWIGHGQPRDRPEPPRRGPGPGHPRHAGPRDRPAARGSARAAVAGPARRDRRPDAPGPRSEPRGTRRLVRIPARRNPPWPTSCTTGR